MIPLRYRCNRLFVMYTGIILKEFQECVLDSLLIERDDNNLFRKLYQYYIVYGRNICFTRHHRPDIVGQTKCLLSSFVSNNSTRIHI